MRFIIILVMTSLLGCNQTPKPVEFQSVDSVIKESQSAFVDINENAKKTDSFITQKVIGVVTKIENLNQEVKELKTENTGLKKAALNVRVDTIYITEKKNFWGKTKTSVDSTQGKEVPDTTNQNK
jgi:hypothetical protein